MTADIQGLLLLSGILAAAAAAGRDADLPDPFVGTAGVGHLTPAAAYPFGMVQAGPDTSADESGYVADWAHDSGYQFGDAFLWRFSQTHLYGTGCQSLGDIGLLPYVGGFDGIRRPARMKKETEVAEPGYYAVTLDEDGAEVRCEASALAHAAAYRIAFPKGGSARLLLDLDWGNGFVGGGDCWGKYVIRSVCDFPKGDRTAVRGGRRVWNWNDYSIWFAARFSAPVKSVRSVRCGDGLRGDIRELDFGVLPDGILEIALGFSAVSPDAAALNLAKEMPTRDFDGVRERSRSAWRRELGRVALDPSTPADIRANFASALYRTMIQPNDLGDAGERHVYSTFSLWDTFRAAHPLYTILVPERVPDMVCSLLDQCDRQGYLPIWALGRSENHCMIGHHAVPVVADACLKGLVPSDQLERAYGAVRQSLTVNHKPVNDGTWGLTKEDWDVLGQYGYYPFDRLSGVYRGNRVKGESVARTLECAYDDACASRLAEMLGKTADAAFFGNRSGGWTNLYDAAVGFMRGKDSNGKWREPFSPYAMGLGPWRENDFCEGNAYQYTWHVMHDPKGLVRLLGGRKRAGERLDELFSARATDHEKDGKDLNCTGCIGQYAHGNEPSHHIAYFYAYTDRPWRTADVVSEIFRLYRPVPDGLCGNDDCGQMAAWYVFSALGFYPFDPCGGNYVIGAPQVPKATIGLPDGRAFTVVAKGLSPERRYVRSVRLNGRPLAGFLLRHADIMSGGELVFEMTDDIRRVERVPFEDEDNTLACFRAPNLNETVIGEGGLQGMSKGGTK